MAPLQTNEQKYNKQELQHYNTSVPDRTLPFDDADLTATGLSVFLSAQIQNPIHQLMELHINHLPDRPIQTVVVAPSDKLYEYLKADADTTRSLLVKKIYTRQHPPAQDDAPDNGSMGEEKLEWTGQEWNRRCQELFQRLEESVARNDEYQKKIQGLEETVTDLQSQTVELKDMTSDMSDRINQLQLSYDDQLALSDQRYKNLLGTIEYYNRWEHTVLREAVDLLEPKLQDRQTAARNNKDWTVCKSIKSLIDICYILRQAGGRETHRPDIVSHISVIEKKSWMADVRFRQGDFAVMHTPLQTQFKVQFEEWYFIKFEKTLPWKDSLRICKAVAWIFYIAGSLVVWKNCPLPKDCSRVSLPDNTSSRGELPSVHLMAQIKDRNDLVSEYKATRDQIAIFMAELLDTNDVGSVEMAIQGNDQEDSFKLQFERIMDRVHSLESIFQAHLSEEDIGSISPNYLHPIVPALSYTKREKAASNWVTKRIVITKGQWKSYLRQTVLTGSPNVDVTDPLFKRAYLPGDLSVRREED